MYRAKIPDRDVSAKACIDSAEIPSPLQHPSPGKIGAASKKGAPLRSSTSAAKLNWDGHVECHVRSHGPWIQWRWTVFYLQMNQIQKTKLVGVSWPLLNVTVPMLGCRMFLMNFTSCSNSSATPSTSSKYERMRFMATGMSRHSPNQTYKSGLRRAQLTDDGTKPLHFRLLRVGA